MQVPHSSKQGYVKSVDNTRIYYETIGNGRPLVFCYGTTCGSFHWKYQQEYFRDRYQIINFDYRGHNKSGMPKKYEQLTIRGCAEDLNAVLQELNIERAVIAGHSMGVNVAIKFFDLFPQKVVGLILACGTVTNPFKTMFRSPLSQVGFELVKGAYLAAPDTFPKLWKRLISNPLTFLLIATLGYNIKLTQKKDIESYIEGVTRHPLETLLYFLQDMAQFNGTPILKKIDVPTLIIGGSNDLLTPIENQIFLNKKIKNSRFLKIPHGSHCSQLDMPELTNLSLSKFLKEIGYDYGLLKFEQPRL